MALFDELAESILRIQTDSRRPSSFSKDIRFEGFVEEVLLPEPDYILVDRTYYHQTSETHFIRQSSVPDLKFSCRDAEFTFWVEIKYRPDFFSDGITLCEQWRHHQYDELNQDCPLFFILGEGGSSDAPEKVYLVPFADAGYTELTKSVLDLYQLSASDAIKTNKLIRQSNRQKIETRPDNLEYGRANP